jgi:hypothetical protein
MVAERADARRDNDWSGRRQDDARRDYHLTAITPAAPVWAAVKSYSATSRNERYVGRAGTRLGRRHGKGLRAE